MYESIPTSLPGLPKTLNLVGAGDQTFNLYQVIGAVRIKSLSCSVQTALAAGLTAAYFDAYDGAVSDPLTLNDGVISSLPIGSLMFKGDLVTATMVVLSSATVVVAEHASEARALKEVIVVQKTGTNTYIRFLYTAAGASSGVLVPHVIWEPICGCSNLIPV